MRVSSSVRMYVIRGDDEFDLQIYGEGYYDRGRMSGPPDACYPPEGEIEIVEIESENKEWDGQLTDEEHKRAIDLLWDAIDYDDVGSPY